MERQGHEGDRNLWVGFRGRFRRRNLSIINKSESEILEPKRNLRQVMSPTDSASRGADEEDKGG